MRDTCYLTLNSRGVVRMTKNPPSSKAGEVAVKVNVVVPDEVFRTPTAEATIEVPEYAVIRPLVDVVVEDPPPEDACAHCGHAPWEHEEPNDLFEDGCQLPDCPCESFEPGDGE